MTIFLCLASKLCGVYMTNFFVSYTLMHCARGSLPHRPSRLYLGSNKMAARVLCARPEFSFRSFFNRTKEILTEAGYCISDSCGNLQRIELLHERLLEARETVFVLRERATEFGPGPGEPGDLEMDNFCRDMAELSNNLSRLIIYFENVVGD